MATREAERPRMITADEAAAQLGVKLGTLYAYVSRGWLRSYRRRIGRQALYRRDDIDALRDLATAEGGRRGRSLPDASSWVTVAQPPSTDGSAYGVIVAESAVSSIIEGRLAYRGYPIEELIARASFEEVCLLLWNGERPQAGAIAALRQVIARTEAPEKVIAALRAVGDDATPLLRLEVVMPALASLERHRGTHPTVEQGTRIMSVLPLALARGRASIASGGAGMAARLASVGLARARGRVGDRHARSHPGRVRRARAQRLDLCGARGCLHRCRPLRRGAGRALFAVGSDSRRRMRSDRADVRATRCRDAPGGVPSCVQRQVAAPARLRSRDLPGRRSARGAAQEGGRARLRAIADAACSRPRSVSRKPSGGASGCVPISTFI